MIAWNSKQPKRIAHMVFATASEHTMMHFIEKKKVL